MLRIGLVPIVRPLFRGARFGLERASSQALRRLGGELGFELAYVADPVAEVAQAAAAAKAAQAAGLDLLLVEHVTFATGEVFLPLLELPMPVGLWALPEVWDTGPLPQNAICGLNLGVSLPLPGRQMPLKWFYGAPEDEWFRERLGLTLQALRGAKVLREGRVLWLGGTAPGFFAFDALPETGMRVERAGLEVLWEALEGVRESEVDELAAAFDELAEYPLEPLRQTFRLELALAQVAQGYDGVAIREWPEIPDRVGVMAYSAMARLADRGYTFAPEGDVMGLAGQLALQAVSRQAAILLDISHFGSKGVMLWHGGEAPRAWAGGPTRLVPHFNRGLPAVRDMPLKAGPVTGLRLLPGRRAVVHGGYLSGEKGYDGDSSWLTQASWAGQELSPKQFLVSWLNHRLPHHLAVGMGEHQPALLELCGWLGLEVLPAKAEESGWVWRA
ncbi:fucose isomerase [Calidithermus timidus]|jgi:L-fucose isomerase-like protein|uniref:fucose isomerase n=1 Tax=Calidithermus timidus TaxID=307124 RepID=UPI0003757656|nr:fucose isomerase [Calidithermus timidus]